MAGIRGVKRVAEVIGDPWSKQDAQTPRQHALLMSFLNLGPSRDCHKLAESTGLSISYIQKLHSEHRWKDAAAAWDANEQKFSADAIRAERAALSTEAVRAALAGVRKALKVLEGCDEQGMKPGEAAQLITAACRVLTALGPVQLEISGSLTDSEAATLADIERMRPEELQELLESLRPS